MVKFLNEVFPLCWAVGCRDNVNINDVLGDYSLTLVDTLDTLVVWLCVSVGVCQCGCVHMLCMIYTSVFICVFSKVVVSLCTSIFVG